MSRKLTLILGAAACTLLCGLCISSQALAQKLQLPDDTGKPEFVHNCTACHLASLVVAVKKTPDDWRKNVDDMAARGTDGTKEDLDKVVVYLDKYYSLQTPAPSEAPHPAPSPPCTPPQPLAPPIESA